ncbi:hypothetical protein [Streptomyces fuscichromogenes]|uniref:Uncharacterized protein n=1 Tax=Streptomyces fuscichromogenes TaxID=1324013 RepID=A0A917XNS8_9ACTN|nr:hypothetical protein GCM10011578_091240 [Streptomyces fuscichromogenes]
MHHPVAVVGGVVDVRPESGPLVVGLGLQTEGYGLTDSPAGLAAWMYGKFAAWTYSGGHPERVLTKDEMLDDITLYWVTNTAVSSSRLPVPSARAHRAACPTSTAACGFGSGSAAPGRGVQ